MAAVVPHRYEMRAVDEMLPHPANARLGNVAALEESIDSLGFYGAVVVQESTGHVLVGNHRRLAALRQGIDSLPTMVVDVDDRTAERILIADNRHSDMATWDQEALLAQLSRLAEDDGGLVGTGFTEGDLAKMLGTGNEDTSPQLGGTTYMVLVEADDEAHQQDLLDQLLGMGMAARPIMG